MAKTVAKDITGTQVPDLTLSDQDGNDVRLQDLKGKRVAFYFYPKDDTPGCTRQACSLRDNWSFFSERSDVAVYGVSPNDAASHQKFIEKYELPFPLLVDAEHVLAEHWGIWKEKNLYGKKSWGIERSTVIIDEDGVVTHVKRRVNPDEHTDWLKEHLG